MHGYDVVSALIALLDAKGPDLSTAGDRDHDLAPVGAELNGQKI